MSPRPLYPEHEMMPIPDSLLLCPRCKQGLIYQPNNAEPFCMKCGDHGRPGELYVRAGTQADWDVRKFFHALQESGLVALSHEDGWAITTPAALNDYAELLRLVIGTPAAAYLHSGCDCTWGSRGERSQGKTCGIENLLDRLRGRT